jgi:nucleoside phosphorylase
MKIYLFVGIGGGIPSNPHNYRDGVVHPIDIHLGDVVVGSPVGTGKAAVEEHDRGRSTPDGFESFGIRGRVMTKLVEAVDKLELNYLDGEPAFHRHLKRLTDPELLKARHVKYEHDTFVRPEMRYDVLFKAEYSHVSGEDPKCSQCSREHIVRRNSRNDPDPVFHRGPIASGDNVIQDGVERDRLSRYYHGIICFEMEAAGVTLETNCLVIRGISDYADSHKGYMWHNYAAATAAAFARQLLYDIEPTTVQKLIARRFSTHAPAAQGSSSFAAAPTIAEAPDSSDPVRSQRGRPAQQQGDDTSTNSSSTAGASTSANSGRVRTHVEALEGRGNLQRTHKNDVGYYP